MPLPIHPSRFENIQCTNVIIKKGNPAAVCLMLNKDQECSDAMLQTIAKEMNLSETAFVTPSPNGEEQDVKKRRFLLRWFTPTVEVPLCGHGTCFEK